MDLWLEKMVERLFQDMDRLSSRQNELADGHIRVSERQGLMMKLLIGVGVGVILMAITSIQQCGTSIIQESREQLDATHNQEQALNISDSKGDQGGEV
jgi:hypothetical protein